MMNAFILGGFLSLVSSRIILRLVGDSPVREGGYEVSDRKPSSHLDGVC